MSNSIEDLISRYIAYWREADVENLMSMYAPAIQYHDITSGAIVTYDDLEQFLKETFTNERDSSLDFKDLVHVEGHSAFIHWTQKLKSSNGDKSIELSGVELIVFDQDKIAKVHEFYDSRETPPETLDVVDMDGRGEQMVKLGLCEGDIATIAEEIRRYFKEQKPYLNSELSLIFIAHQLGYTRNQVSFVINRVLASNFYDFVNRHRIEYVIDHMKEATGRYSVMNAAVDAGFNSISGFYNAFKKQTGVTPSAFRKAMLERLTDNSTRVRVDD